MHGTALARTFPSVPHPTTTPSLSFQRDLAAALDALQRNLAGALRELGIAEPRGVDIQRALGIDKTLAWKLSRFCTTAEPLAGVSHLPGEAALSLAIDSLANQRGASETVIDQLREAAASVRDVIARHSSDRRAAQVLLDSLPGASRDTASLRHRRDAFHAQAFLLGVRARVQAQCTIFWPSDDPGRLDAATIGCLLGLVRNREALPWIVGRSGRPATVTDPQRPVRRPIDDQAASAHRGLPLLGDFSSPGISLTRVPTTDPYVEELELAPGPVGDLAAVDCVVGERLDRVMPLRTDRALSISTRARTPSERHVLDVYIHESCAPEAAPQVSVFHEVNGPVWRYEDAPPHARLAFDPHLTTATQPTAQDAEHTLAHVSEHAFERLGLTPKQFVRWRAEVRYPAVPSALWIAWPATPT